MEQTTETKPVDKIKEILEKYEKSVQKHPVSAFVKNPWNPNVQPEIIFQSLKKSIQKYGWLQFPVVREYVGQYQIIDGEHRIRAAKELGLGEVMVLVLGNDKLEVSDEDAMLLTQLLNTRGQDDVLKRADLLKKIKESNQPDLFDFMPLTAKQIEQELELLNFDFSQFDKASLADEEVTRAQKALDISINFEKELRKIYAESSNVKFRLLLEQFFEWIKVFRANVEKEG